MKALINKIIPFSNVDGPGNRMAIFFQGCNLNCMYCHNPETINICTNCQKCVNSCPYGALIVKDNKVIWNDLKCRQCDTCIQICPRSSSPKVKEYSVEELIEEIKKVKPYIRGITLSGGECMLQSDFLSRFIKEIKKLNLSILLDSNGSILFEEHVELMSYIDGVMLDIKAADKCFYYTLCQSSFNNVERNLHYLLNTNKLHEVRTVLLPHFEEENIKTITYVSNVIKDKCQYELICYRPYGVKKEYVDTTGLSSYNKENALRLKEKAISLGAIHTTII